MIVNAFRFDNEAFAIGARKAHMWIRDTEWSGMNMSRWPLFLLCTVSAIEHFGVFTFDEPADPADDQIGVQVVTQHVTDPDGVTRFYPPGLTVICHDYQRLSVDCPG